MAEVSSWLSSIMEYEPATTTQPRERTLRVPQTMRAAESDPLIYEPRVISLGPFHHSKPHLQPMEDKKKLASKFFVSDTNQNIETLYQKVSDMVQASKHFYCENLDHITDEHFSQMMFLDSCFVLQFIRSVTRFALRSLPIEPHLQSSVMRDMFLLENQVPFAVLETLMGSERGAKIEFIDRFVCSLIRAPGVPRPRWSLGFLGRVERNRRIGKPKQVHHLLHLLRSKLLRYPMVDDRRVVSQKDPEAPGWPLFVHSASDLSKAGIKLERSSSNSFRDVRFKSGVVYGKLFLPPLLVDNFSKQWLLNLVAYELSCPTNYGIVSYIRLMDSLINDAEDVKELRSKDILYSSLGSDQEVADLFKGIAKELIPNPRAYAEVTKKMEAHYKSVWRVHFATLFDTYFSSPWTLASLMAAIFLLLLTMVQAYFTTFPRKK